MVRGVVSLPNGTGRSAKVAVFAKGAKAEEAKSAGADIVGAEDLPRQVGKGEINFDRCIATPDMMGIVGRLGKVLGPRGLMPNPKVGTVTMDVTQAVKDAKGGAVEFRVEKAGIVHAGVGKASFEEKAIAANVRALIDSVIKAKPAGRQRNISEEDFHQLDHGTGREDRARFRWSGWRIGERDFRRACRRKTCPRPQASHLEGLNRQSQRRRGENRRRRDEVRRQSGLNPGTGVAVAEA